MTIQDCITAIDTRKPNKYTTAEKIAWLSFLEFNIINEVLKTHEGYDSKYDDFNGYTEDDLLVSLIITSPYDSLYVDYIEMRIDEANGETSIYNASASQYNAKYLEFKKWYNKTHMPLSVSGSTNFKTVQRYTVELTDAERESIVTQLNNSLTNHLYDLVSDAKLYELAQNYFSNNTELFKGKDGKDGADGKDGTDGKSFTYADLTSEQKKELSGSATLAQSWAVGKTGAREGENENNAMFFSGISKDYAQISETCANAAEDAQTYAEAAQKNTANNLREVISYANDALMTAIECESWVAGGTGTRPDEDTNNSLYFCEESEKCAKESKKYAEDTKGYIESSMHVRGNVSGIGAVRLDFIPEKLHNLVVNTTDVKSYGKNLYDFEGNKGGIEDIFINDIRFLSTISIILSETKNVGTIRLQRKGEDGSYSNVGYYSGSSSAKAFYTVESGDYKIATSKNTEAGAIESVQIELGDKATVHEEYISPVNGVKVICPTTTLIANNPEAEITATYNKDIGLVVADLEEKIATLEDALAKA